MCAIYSLRIILLVNNIHVRNFRRFGWNENFLTTKISRITVVQPFGTCPNAIDAIAPTGRREREWEGGREGTRTIKWGINRTCSVPAVYWPTPGRVFTSWSAVHGISPPSSSITLWVESTSASWFQYYYYFLLPLPSLPLPRVSGLLSSTPVQTTQSLPPEEESCSKSWQVLSQTGVHLKSSSRQIFNGWPFLSKTLEWWYKVCINVHALFFLNLHPAIVVIDNCSNFCL